MRYQQVHKECRTKPFVLQFVVCMLQTSLFPSPPPPPHLGLQRTLAMKCKILLINDFNGHILSITPNTKKTGVISSFMPYYTPHCNHTEESQRSSFWCNIMQLRYLPVYIWATLVIAKAAQVTIWHVSLHCTYLCLHMLEIMYSRKIISSWKGKLVPGCSCK